MRSVIEGQRDHRQACPDAGDGTEPWCEYQVLEAGADGARQATHGSDPPDDVGDRSAYPAQLETERPQELLPAPRLRELDGIGDQRTERPQAGLEGEFRHPSLAVRLVQEHVVLPVAVRLPERAATGGAEPD